MEKGDKEYHFFIAHASEDKDDIARPLAEYLHRAGYEVWYDEFSLRAGDSLRESIDKGLASSCCGIVVLSHNFVAKGWPRAELDGLVGLHMDGEVKQLLPIWHEMTEGEVRAFSPLLAGKRGIPTHDGFERVAHDVVRAVEPDAQATVRIREGNLPVARALFVFRAEDAAGASRILVFPDAGWDCYLLPNWHVEGRQLQREDDPYLCGRVAEMLGLVPDDVHARHVVAHKLRSHKLSATRGRETTYEFHFFGAVCEAPVEFRGPSFAVGQREYRWLTLPELHSSHNADRNNDVFGHLSAHEDTLVSSVPLSCVLDGR